MAQVTFDVDTSDTDSRLPQFQRMLANLPPAYIEVATEITGDQMRQEIPKGQSGKLEGSVTAETYGNEGIVQTNTGYGKAVDEGRRGFTVYGNPFLRFFYMGKIVYARKASPGPAAPNNFTKRTIIGAASRIAPEIDSTTQRMLSV